MSFELVGKGSLKKTPIIDDEINVTKTSISIGEAFKKKFEGKDYALIFLDKANKRFALEPTTDGDRGYKVRWDSKKGQMGISKLKELGFVLGRSYKARRHTTKIICNNVEFVNEEKKATSKKKKK